MPFTLSIRQQQQQQWQKESTEDRLYLTSLCEGATHQNPVAEANGEPENFTWIGELSLSLPGLEQLEHLLPSLIEIFFFFLSKAGQEEEILKTEYSSDLSKSKVDTFAHRGCLCWVSLRRSDWMDFS